MSRFHKHIQTHHYIPEEIREWFADYTLDLIESELRYKKENVSSLAVLSYFTIPKQNNIYETGEVNTIRLGLKNLLELITDLEEKIDTLNVDSILTEVRKNLEIRTNSLYWNLKRLSENTEKPISTFYKTLLNLLAASYITEDTQNKIKYLYYTKRLLDKTYYFSRDKWNKETQTNIVESTVSGNVSYFSGKNEVSKIKPVSHIVRYIDSNSKESINLQEIRNLLSKDSKYYGLREISPDKLIIQDEKELEIPEEMELGKWNPIIINGSGWVVDGRHRAVYAKEHNKKIWVWCPMEMKV